MTKDYAIKIKESEPGRLHVTATHKGLECFFYPKDRESRAECEAMVAMLQEDLKAL